MDMRRPLMQKLDGVKFGKNEKILASKGWWYDNGEDQEEEKERE